MTEDYRVTIGGIQFDPKDRTLPTLGGDDEPVETPKAWLVQFVHPLDRAESAALRDKHGLRLTQYVAPFAYIERISVKTAAALESEELVRAVMPYTAEFAVSSAARNQAANDNDFGDSAFNALLFEDADTSELEQALISLGAHDVTLIEGVRGRRQATLRFSIAASRVHEVADLAAVQWVEPVSPAVDDRAAAPHPALQPAMAGMFESLWAAGLCGQDQVIAIIDNGPPDLRHCFFIDGNHAEAGTDHRKVVAIRNGVGQPPGSHATFTAGCAVGDAVNDPGASADRGAAWAATLVAGNRMDLIAFSGSGGSTLLNELSAASDCGAFIHTNSWHSIPQGPRRPATYDLTASDVDAFTWSHEDCLVLGSSGNTGEEQGPPGTAKNALCVSAATDGSPDASVGDGATGPTADGRNKPDLMVVGCGIRSAIVGTDCETGPRAACASSYATPLAAGAAALLRQYFIEGRFPGGAPDASSEVVPTGALLKAILISSARDTGGDGSLPDLRGGWGLLQLHRSLPGLADSDCAMDIIDARNSEGLSAGESTMITSTVQVGDAPLKITLAWSDPPPALPDSATPVVNNLNLEVLAPDGKLFRGNCYENRESVSGGQPDVTNNVETVTISQPVPGDWRVTVRAVQVNVGAPAQGFALVVTGLLDSSRIQSR